MIILAIHDTNIFIDLADCGLIDELFELFPNILTTDFAINEVASVELRAYLAPKLDVRETSPEKIPSLFELQNSFKGLSVIDISVMELAKSCNGILCTTDQRLKKVATMRGIDSHGTIWIIEQMIIENIISKEKGVEALTKIRTSNKWASKSIIDSTIDRINKSRIISR